MLSDGTPTISEKQLGASRCLYFLDNSGNLYRCLQKNLAGLHHACFLRAVPAPPSQKARDRAAWLHGDRKVSAKEGVHLSTPGAISSAGDAAAETTAVSQAARAGVREQLLQQWRVMVGDQPGGHVRGSSQAREVVDEWVPVDQNGHTHFHALCNSADFAGARALLLRWGCGIDIVNMRTKARPVNHTPLMLAAAGQDPMSIRGKLCQMLVDHKADCLAQDGDGKTALHKAAAVGGLAVCHILVSACPQLVHVKDSKGRGPADFAAKSNGSVRSFLCRVSGNHEYKRAIPGWQNVEARQQSGRPSKVSRKT